MQGWQHKLTQLNVANFPWDPKPDPTATTLSQATTAVGSTTSSTPTLSAYRPAQQVPAPAPALPMPPVPLMSQAAANGGPDLKLEPGGGASPHIKPEPGLGPAGVPSSVPAYQSSSAAASRAGGLGAERAIQNVTAQFGSRAATSINAIRSQVPLAAGNAGPSPHQQAQYHQRMAAAQAQHQQHQQHQRAAGQMDGAADEVGGSDDDVEEGRDAYEGVLMRQTAQGTTEELGRLDIDRMLHDHIAAQAKKMEGGGLMVPLKQAKGTSTGRKSSKGKEIQGGGVDLGQMDGPGADDDVKSEDDADAINSDLDDPDDGKDSSEDEDEMLGYIMLCMYDKVQRVKNKWLVAHSPFS